ncbi:transmembrane amino acid transporter protein-domain-containing protein [Paraphoma chrysanthemicola]|uniref:Transmembrane amino acid transporter protein-domain-containing protein n=1 Tax=Paraphoma chrysanthemicola TaxID=798071 RepID=A0A8K0RJ73_9PLEO|nr:transmembrane amino acid transporter protein-domain-containing protein [Paraphoma chrysanthemicola]
MSESQKLLHEHPSDSDSEPEHERQPSPLRLSPSPSSSRATSTSPAPPGSRPNGFSQKRQSSFAQPRPDGAPRTPNRVRFEEEALRRSLNGHAPGGDWIELDGDDYMSANGGDGRERVQRLPLLTGIEAPSVTVAEEAFDPEDYLESARPRSGMRSAFMNMANSIIGAGIIGQPYAIRNAGLVTGTALLIGLTIIVDWTIRLIVINSKLSGTDSFQATVQHCFGKSGLVAISLAQWLFAFGGMVAFCVIVGDTIPTVMQSLFPSLDDMAFLWLLTDRRAVMILLILGISYPLSLYRDIAKLAKASGFALVSMSVIIVTVITQAFRVPAESRGQLRGSLIIHSGIFEAIGVISFAFVCHHNSLLIYGSLRKPTIDRFSRVTHYSTSISLVACLVMALSGYLTFGDKTLGNVLNNFPKDNLMVNIARLFFGLNMLTTLPLEAFVCREVMNNYWFPDDPFHPNRHLIFSTSLVVTALALSLLTCDLGVVFELFGATSACALAFILPPLCYIKLSKKSSKTYLAMAVVAFGCTVMVISIIKTTSKMAMGTGEHAQCS